MYKGLKELPDKEQVTTLSDRLKDRGAEFKGLVPTLKEVDAVLHLSCFLLYNSASVPLHHFRSLRLKKRGSGSATLKTLIPPTLSLDHVGPEGKTVRL